MAENGTDADKNDSGSTLNEVIEEQSKTIETLVDRLKQEESLEPEAPQTIFNTSPTAPKKPADFVTIGLMVVVGFFVLRSLKVI